MTRWRYIAQRATTGEFIDLDLPIEVEELSWGLGSAGALTGTISPDVGALRDADGHLLLEEWGTFLYAEADDQIRWGGILVSSAPSGEDWNIEAAEFKTYPHGIAYLGEFSQIGVDPALAYREIWSHIQSFPDGNLGVTVTGDSTPVRLGTPARTEPAAPNEDGTPGTPREIEAEPYALLWWEAKDSGAELETLAKTTPFDVTESHRWADDNRDAVVHEVQIHYPRTGRRREDIAFIQGDNVTNVIAFESSGDEYANEVVGIGAGEGRTSLRRSTARRDGRLRRTTVHTAKDVQDEARLDALIREELERRRGLVEITSVDVIDHPNAPLASWSLGDDVLVDAHVPWLGRVQVWCRVTGWSLTGEDTASLSLARSDSYNYGG